MAKILKLATDASTESGIGGNSQVITSGTLVSKVAGFVEASAATEEVVGIAHTEKTFAADNQTVGKDVVIYVKVTDDLRVEMVADAAVTQADEGSYFDINTADQTVDVLTKSATTGTVQMIKFVDTNTSVYAIVNK